MIGILIVSHGDLGRELVKAAELIMGRLDACDVIAISANPDCETLIKRISDKIQTLDTGQGVLLLTDMFGGTPSNLCLSFLDEKAVEVLTGVNLPMLITIAQYRNEMSIAELGKKSEEAGRKGISLASGLIKRS